MCRYVCRRVKVESAAEGSERGNETTGKVSETWPLAALPDSDRSSEAVCLRSSTSRLDRRSWSEMSWAMCAQREAQTV